MKISVAMATYNGKDYLIEQLDSLRLQTLTIDEMVFCDDCSTDGTPEIIADYISKYRLEATWHFYPNEHNLGYADNFHRALTLCTGDYVFFTDQDDIWLPNKLQVMVDIMQKRPDIKLLCCDFEPFTSSNDAPNISKKVLSKMDDSGRLEKIELNYKNIYIGSLGCLMGMARDFIDNAENYWFKGWPHDEYVWKLAQCYDGCYIYHKNLVRRRLHSNNVSMHSMHTLKKRIDYLAALLDSHIATLKCTEDLKLSEKKQRVLRRNVRATELRLDLFRKKKLLNCFRLLRYTNCYHSRKSILVEPLLVIRGK